MIFLATLVASILGTEVSSATVVTYGEGSAVSSYDQKLTFDRLYPSNGSAGLTGVSLFDYSEAGVSVTTSKMSFYGGDQFNGQASGGYYYPNGGSRDPIFIQNGFGFSAIEVLIGHGRGRNDPVYFNWETNNGSGSVTVPVGSIVGFHDPFGFRYLKLGVGGHALSLDNMLVKRSEVALLPVPAGMPLLLSGLLGFVAFSFRRQQAL